MRANTQLERQILEMTEPLAEELGLDIVRIRVMGSKNLQVQIMAERPDGTVDVEDCARLSRALSPVIDVEDPIAGEYTLEVSSPGIDRPLTRAKDFAVWVGHEARVETKYQMDMPDGTRRKRFRGALLGEEDGEIRMDLGRGGQIALGFEDLASARLELTDALIEAARLRRERAVPSGLNHSEDQRNDATEAEL